MRFLPIAKIVFVLGNATLAPSMFFLLLSLFKRELFIFAGLFLSAAPVLFFFFLLLEFFPHIILRKSRRP